MDAENPRHLPYRRVDAAQLKARLEAVRTRMVAGLLSTTPAAAANSDDRVAFFEQIARDALVQMVAERARAEAYRDALQLLAATR